MEVLQRILSADEREQALKAEEREALKAFVRLNSETAHETRDEHGLTPELVAAVRRCIRASIERGAHMIHWAKSLEDVITEYEAEET